MLKVLDNVPIPAIKRASGMPRKYPLKSMEVGQMIFIPGRTVRSVVAYISRISKDLDAKFTARNCWMAEYEIEGGGREWRLAEPSVLGAKEGTGVWRTE